MSRLLPGLHPGLRSSPKLTGCREHSCPLTVPTCAPPPLALSKEKAVCPSKRSLTEMPGTARRITQGHLPVLRSPISGIGYNRRAPSATQCNRSLGMTAEGEGPGAALLSSVWSSPQGGAGPERVTANHCGKASMPTEPLTWLSWAFGEGTPPSPQGSGAETVVGFSQDELQESFTKANEA